MKDIKSVFEKIGLIEKVQAEDMVLNGTENQPSDLQVNDVPVKTAANEKGIENRNINRENVIKDEEKKLLKSDEIYDSFHIKSAGVTSLFIVESFLKALPDYLPNDVKRQSVLNIIASSGMSIESLMKDGNDRLRCLNDFLNNFSYEIKNTIKENEDEIEKLTKKINSYKKQIDYMKKLQMEQDAIVDYESERINNILHFISPDKL